MKVFDEYFIQHKLFCITMNNTENNETMMKAISFSLQVADIEWNPREYHIIYLNHVINLAMQDFLKSIKGLTEEEEE